MFRNTSLDDAGHVEFARCFGGLLDMRQYLPAGHKTRLETYELADLANIDADTGNPINPQSIKAQIGKATAYFHADLSYSSHRATFSILRACQLPPPGHGGDTIFTDTRMAYEELDEVHPGLKYKLLNNNYIGAHSWQHLQKVSNPELYEDLDPTAYDMALHKIVQRHEPSGRLSLYIGSYMHHIEGRIEEREELAELQEKLMNHATQEKYQLSVRWENPGDMILWDNRQVREIVDSRVKKYLDIANTIRQSRDA